MTAKNVELVNMRGSVKFEFLTHVFTEKPGPIDIDSDPIGNIRLQDCQQFVLIIDGQRFRNKRVTKAHYDVGHRKDINIFCPIICKATKARARRWD